MPILVAPALPGNGRLGPPYYLHAFSAQYLMREPGPVPPDGDPLQRARRFQPMLDTGQVRDAAELARPPARSGARMTTALPGARADEG